MAAKTFYNNVLNMHNLHPYHKSQLRNANLILEGKNPSCGDDIVLQLYVVDDVIEDGAFAGVGCAVSQASADMMLDLIIGETKERALHLADIFLRMITGKVTEEEMEELDEAASLSDIAHMPSRTKCAVLGWHTLQEMLGEPTDASSSPL